MNHLCVDIQNLNVYFGSHHVLKNFNLPVEANSITALIGPSGCGKSTLLRTINRMNDFITDNRVDGKVIFEGVNIYDPEVDPAEIRYRIGMVFQKPNPFPKSIYDNVAFGARINGYTGKMDDLVENSLKRAALWDEVKDNLHKNAYKLSGGQQQRLCIARALSVNPSVILMDEPTSALDPLSTYKIEQLLLTLKEQVTIFIVTHNMFQAARIADKVAFILHGEIIEYGSNFDIFTEPKRKETENYVTGRFG